MKSIYKKLIAILILAVLIGGFAYLAKNWKTETVESEVIAKRFDAEEAKAFYVLENDDLKFTLDSATTQFKVEMKSNGDVWYSNPQGASEDPSVGLKEKNKLASTLILNYSTDRIKNILMNNYEFGISTGLYEIEEGDGYIRINYSIGDVPKTFVFPTIVPAERFEEYAAAWEAIGNKRAKSYYKKWDIVGDKEPSATDLKDDPDIKEKMLADYPMLAEEVCYVLRRNKDGSPQKDSIKASLEEFFAEIGYTEEQYKLDKDNDLSLATNNKPVFNISMIYKLEGDRLIVEIPYDQMSWKDGYSISYLTVLPYMGAGLKTEKGSLLIPEGGGALMDFNNGKVTLPSYSANVYGWDWAISKPDLVHETRANFNAFGILKETSSMLCTLDEGSSYAAINADVSGKSENAFSNYVQAMYQISHKDVYRVTAIAGDDIYIFEETLPNESIVQSYWFKPTNSYAELASVYRDYLFAKYDVKPVLRDKNETPLAVEIVGAVDKAVKVLGVPVNSPFELTSIKEAGEILNFMSDAGLKDVNVKLNGYLNGGIKQSMLTSPKIVSQTGSKSQMKKLSGLAEDLGYSLYLNGITAYAQDSSILDGFNFFSSPARFPTKERAAIYPYSAVTFAQRDSLEPKYLLRPDLMVKMANNLINFTDKVGTDVSFDDIGKELSADYHKDEVVSREAVLNMQVDILKGLNESDKKICVNVGNSYAAPYSDIIVDMDLHGNEYGILDTFVPFYQMALHGYVDYTGISLNLADDIEDEILFCAEYGAGLNFTLMDESVMKLQNTMYTEYYGAEFDIWGSRMVKMYNEFNEKMGSLFNKRMVDHEQISTGLSCTTYEDGTMVLVNYTYGDLGYRGNYIPARSFIVTK
ncbi:MAG: DUF5696 domain-containing protein [Lachnospiraceae bacterium]|nr:DUF5696 domain-containing protein [Lachnospiraceae bacterium]